MKKVWVYVRWRICQGEREFCEQKPYTKCDNEHMQLTVSTPKRLSASSTDICDCA